ncbi:MAG: TlpA family protein disulfide reductase [Bacteroidales bacterium]|nr:TlpA family protein disulfide reductase [Bacteroidales bacterium]
MFRVMDNYAKMQMKKLFLTLIITFATVCGFAQENTSVALDEGIFHSGNVVLKGCFKGYPQDSLPKQILAMVRNYFTMEEDNQLVEVNADGTFCGKVHVPHGQMCMVDAGVTQIGPFLFPGDTIEVVLTSSGIKYVPNSSMNSMLGERSLLEEISRYRKSPYGDLSNPYPYIKNGNKDSVQLYIERNMEVMEQVAAEIASGAFDFPADFHPLLREIVQNDVMLVGLTNIAGAICKHNTRMHVIETDTLSGNSVAHPNEDFVPLDLEPIKAFFVKHEKQLFDNQFLLFHNVQFWLPLNLLQFSVYWPMMTHVYIPANDKEEYYRNDRVALFADSNLAALQEVQKMYGVSPDCFLSQLMLVNHFPAYGCEEDFDDKVKGFSRLIDNPIVKYHFEEYCKRQGKLPAVKNIADCDVARRLFSEYEGNVLLLDFWSMGCAPCRKGMIEQKPVVEHFKGKPVKFLYIASTENDDPVTARTWMSEKEIEGEALFITPNDWAALMGFLNFSATPSTFLIDTDGNVDNKHYTIPDLEKRIEELLK